MERPQIIIQIGNEIVKGKITFYSKRGLSVEILSPYQNIEHGVYVPIFTQRNLEENEVESFAKTLLTSIYEMCEFARQNKDILSEKLVITKHEIQPIYELINSLTEEKINLKNKFKKKEINNVEYQQQLKTVKREKTKKEFEIFQCWSRYFESFPMIVPIDMQMPIIELIEKL